MEVRPLSKGAFAWCRRCEQLLTHARVGRNAPDAHRRCCCLPTRWRSTFCQRCALPASAGGAACLVRGCHWRSGCTSAPECAALPRSGTYERRSSSRLGCLTPSTRPRAVFLQATATRTTRCAGDAPCCAPGAYSAELQLSFCTSRFFIGWRDACGAAGASARRASAKDSWCRGADVCTSTGRSPAATQPQTQGGRWSRGAKRRSRQLCRGNEAARPGERTAQGHASTYVVHTMRVARPCAPCARTQELRRPCRRGTWLYRPACTGILALLLPTV